MTHREAPFMDAEPPHWVARGLTIVILSLFGIALVAAVIVEVPETVSGRFRLVPIDGSDPVRVSRSGTVSQVLVREQDTVAQGAPLLVVRSASLSDRSASRRTLESQRATDQLRLTILRSQYETRRRADSAEARRLANRVEYLEGLIASKSRRLTLTRELADSALAGARRGAIGTLEASRLDLEANTLAEEVESARNDLAEARSDIARLTQDQAARDLEYQEGRRSLLELIETAEIRIASLGHDLVGTTDSGFAVTAPCRGTVLRLHVRARGAVVQEGEIVGEMACAGSRLQGELALPQPGVPLIRVGQGVKLRFDAFPYQRYGVRFGEVRWFGPSGAADSGSFRALVELRDDSIQVRGRKQPLLAGMAGSADIVTGRRSLASFVLEPIRTLRESFAEPPPP